MTTELRVDDNVWYDALQYQLQYPTPDLNRTYYRTMVRAAQWAELLELPSPLAIELPE